MFGGAGFGAELPGATVRVGLKVVVGSTVWECARLKAAVGGGYFRS